MLELTLTRVHNANAGTEVPDRDVSYPSSLKLLKALRGPCRRHGLHCTDVINNGKIFDDVLEFNRTGSLAEAGHARPSAAESAQR